MLLRLLYVLSGHFTYGPTGFSGLFTPGQRPVNAGCGVLSMLLPFYVLSVRFAYGLCGDLSGRTDGRMGVCHRAHRAIHQKVG